VTINAVYPNKSPAVADMGDRARAKWVQNGVAVPLSLGELGSHVTQCRLGQAYLRSKSHPDPSSRLATIDMGSGSYGHRLAFVRKPQKWGGAVTLSFRVQLSPRTTQCGLARGLPSYQVAS